MAVSIVVICGGEPSCRCHHVGAIMQGSAHLVRARAGGAPEPPPCAPVIIVRQSHSRCWLWPTTRRALAWRRTWWAHLEIRSDTRATAVAACSRSLSCLGQLPSCGASAAHAACADGSLDQAARRAVGCVHPCSRDGRWNRPNASAPHACRSLMRGALCCSWLECSRAVEPDQICSQNRGDGGLQARQTLNYNSHT